MKKFTKLLVALVVCIVSVCAVACSPKTEEGEKSISVVIGTEVYSLNTDAEYLDDALTEIDGITYDIQESEYGVFINSIEDLIPVGNQFVCVMSTIDDELVSWKDSSQEFEGKIYYSSNYGISQLPVLDGESYMFILMSY